MIVRDWHPSDNQQIVLQDEQVDMREMINNGYMNFEPLVEHGLVKSIVSDNGEILLIGGLAPQWEGRAILFSLLSKHAKNHMIGIHRITTDFIKERPFVRIEAQVKVGFTAGHKWIKMLGFEVEGLLKKFYPSGDDYVMYSRVR